MLIETKERGTIIENKDDEVIVTIEYSGNSIQFPINPETIKNESESNSLSEKVEGMGEISVPQSPSLSTMTFSSFFAKTDDESKSPKKCVEWIKLWQRSKLPATLVISGFDWEGWNMDVTCEAFSYWVNAGEEEDIYFDISLREYRAYGAKKVTLQEGQYLIDENNQLFVIGKSDAYFAYPNDNETRPKIRKGNIPAMVRTGEDESLAAIGRRVAGDDTMWLDIYTVNKPKLASTISKSIDTGKAASEFADETTNLTDIYNPTIEAASWLVRILAGPLI